jgi:hypothetical protein
MDAATANFHSERTQPLNEILRPIHRAWLDECRGFLEAALEPEPDIWARWTAVRYLADEFIGRYTWARALVDELRPFLPPAVADRLQRHGDRLRFLRLELDRIGRRSGTATEFAAGVRDLLDQLALWCVEIETAARGLTCDTLPLEAVSLIGHLEVALQVEP